MSGPILIWGAGAVGGVLGACLARAGHTVHMVDVVPEHVEAMRTTGLRIEGPVEEFTQVLPASLPGEVSGLHDRVFLCVKAHHTEAALEALAPYVAPGGFVVSAQNGLNELTIARRIGHERTIGCFVNYGADWLEPGRILWGNRAAVAVGELDGRITDRARTVHDLLRLVEPDAVLTENIWGYLWGKMGYGALLFATALSPDSMSDAMAHSEHRDVYAALGHEVMTLAGRGGRAAPGVQWLRPRRLPAGRPGRDGGLARRDGRAQPPHGENPFRRLARPRRAPPPDGGGRADRRDVRHGPRAGGADADAGPADRADPRR